MRSEWTTLKDTILKGAEWMTSTTQPKDAGVHHGIGNHVGGTLYVSFNPWGQFTKRKSNSIYWGKKPGPVDMRRPGSGSIIFGLAEHEWVDYDTDPATYGPRIEPFSPEEIAEFRELLVEAGLKVDDQWNGVSPDGRRLHTVSFGVANVRPTLVRAASNYMDGCPEHDSVFCYNEECSWYEDIHARLLRPVFVEGEGYEMPEPPEVGGDDDTNLRAVKRTLARITPILMQMGIHPATVVAGHRGHIEGDEHLEFVSDQGHGVLIPAETAERLVAAAVLAFELGLEEQESSVPIATRRSK